MPDKYWFKFRHPLSQLLWIERAQAQSLLLPKGINRGITRVMPLLVDPIQTDLVYVIESEGLFPLGEGIVLFAFLGFSVFFPFLFRPALSKRVFHSLLK